MTSNRNRNGKWFNSCCIQDLRTGLNKHYWAPLHMNTYVFSRDVELNTHQGSTKCCPAAIRAVAHAGGRTRGLTAYFYIMNHRRSWAPVARENVPPGGVFQPWGLHGCRAFTAITCISVYRSGYIRTRNFCMYSRCQKI